MTQYRFLFLFISITLLFTISCSEKCPEHIEIEKSILLGTWGGIWRSKWRNTKKKEGGKFQLNPNDTFTYTSFSEGAISGRWEFEERTITLNFNNSSDSHEMHPMNGKVEDMFICKFYKDSYNKEHLTIHSPNFGRIFLVKY